ncbi:serine hydrolase domain-containing protein [Winogradskyella luteola]|uniref:Beta-lactamase family protein n=1 Tax=Winogradskyella luteola TaxID=2828330 RepID=A0A9X1F6D4_9FLAO|nr:serine hydrolase domain-containing protein [Winogradskyella luteola]MBV7267949.1 beta-lactamase family protein [Winogradskyella luteola]
MKNILLIILATTLHLLSCTTHEEKVKKIDELIQANVKSLKPFSGSVLVAQDGEIVYKGAFGYSDIKKRTKNKIDSKYFIGSITKQFTTVAILQLVEKGRIDLSDKLEKWIPEVNGSDKITIHHLLSHQSGLKRDSYQDYNENVSHLERVLSVKNDTLRFHPGTKSEYSSVGFYALTYIIEQVSEMKYEEYLNTFIFKPAKLKNTGLRQKKGQKIPGLSIGINRAPDEYGVDNFAFARYFDSYSLGGGGSLYSTVDDLYKFHVAVEDGTLLSKKNVDLMKKRWPLQKEPRPFNTYGWEVWDYLKSKNDPILVYGFSGRIYGYKSMHRYYKKDNIVVIVLTNSEFSERSLLGYAIRDILLDRKYSIPKSAPKKIPLTQSMKKHIGVYDFPSEKTTVEIKIINGKMTLSSHGDNPMYIYPADENTFYSNLIPLKIKFYPTTDKLTQKLEFNHNNEFIKTIERIE